MLVCTHTWETVLLFFCIYSFSLSLIPSLSLSLFPYPSLHPSIHPSVHLSILSSLSTGTLHSVAFFCVPQRQCSLLSQITSDHLPAPSLLPGALRPTACSWAVPDVLFLHRPHLLLLTMCECLRGIFRVTWTPSSSAGQDESVCFGVYGATYPHYCFHILGARSWESELWLHNLHRWGCV